MTAMAPIAIAVAGVVWPPVARGNLAFPALVWLGILAILCLVPSIAGVLNQLLAFGSQTLLPSFEAAYPWLLALLATSLFSGFGIARRLQGGSALRRRRLIAGTTIAAVLTALSGAAFGAVAVVNDIAIRDATTEFSRFGPTTGGEQQPPPCDSALGAGRTARLDLHMTGTVDLRPIGSLDVNGLRVGTDLRWLAYVATNRELGQYGVARSGDRAWTLRPGTRWERADATAVAADTLDLQALDVALSDGYRATAEDRGVEVIEGARARRCRIAVDGPTFAEAFPQARWLVGDADLHRWRGQLDYWIFLDGQLGQVAGSINGEAAGLDPDALQGTIDVRLSATERGRDFVIYPPGP
jgi:hypothetical protein